MAKQHDAQVLLGLCLRREWTVTIAHRNDVFSGHAVVGNAAPTPSVAGGIGLMGLGLALVTVAVLLGDEWRLRQGDWRDEAVAMPLVRRRLDSEQFRSGPAVPVVVR